MRNYLKLQWRQAVKRPVVLRSYEARRTAEIGRAFYLVASLENRPDDPLYDVLDVGMMAEPNAGKTAFAAGLVYAPSIKDIPRNLLRGEQTSYHCVSPLLGRVCVIDCYTGDGHRQNLQKKFKKSLQGAPLKGVNVFEHVQKTPINPHALINVIKTWDDNGNAVRYIKVRCDDALKETAGYERFLSSVDAVRIK